MVVTIIYHARVCAGKRAASKSIWEIGDGRWQLGEADWKWKKAEFPICGLFRRGYALGRQAKRKPK